MLIQSFVKRQRPLSKNKQILLETLLPKFRINPEKYVLLSKNYKTINLEIGFGKGDFLTNNALNNTEKHSLNIGCEPYIEGVVSLLQKIHKNNIKNITIWPDDARLLLTQLPNNSIDCIYILFPDPWPKKKHHKRRLVNLEFINLIAAKLKPEGIIFTATDHYEYANCIYAHFEQNDTFLRQDISKDSTNFFKNSTATNTVTSIYHQKNLEGTEVKLFKFTKK